MSARHLSERFDTFSPLKPTPAYDEATKEAADDPGHELDPREAAELFEQTTRQAESQFELRPPLLTIAVVLGPGPSGRSSRRRGLEGVAFGSIWISVYVFQAALHQADPNRGIAYGLWPAVAPLIVVGSAAAGYEVARGHRAGAGLAVAAVALGAFASFAGPADVWGVVGVGLCALLIGGAAQLRQRVRRV